MAHPQQDSSNLVWPRQLTRLPPWMLFTAVTLLALAILYVEVPGRPLILHSLQKFGHPVVFGLIAVGLFGIRRHVRPFGGPLGDYLPTLLVGTALGIFTELAQIITHRDPALRDVVLDVRGIICALSLLAAFDPRCRRGTIGTKASWFFLATAALIATVTLAPLVWVSAAYTDRAMMAPVLFKPRHTLDLLLISLTDTAPELGTLPTAFAHTPGELALRVPLTTRPYAGVVLDEPLSDWRPQHTLHIDVTNPTHVELPLHIRVQDRIHNGVYSDRFEGIEVIAATSRRMIEIPLERIATGPRNRRLDLRHVGPVMLYKMGGEGAREFWLSTVELR